MDAEAVELLLAGLLGGVGVEVEVEGDVPSVLVLLQPLANIWSKTRTATAQ